MKRTPLKRKTRLRVKGRSRFPKRREEAFRDWIREQPCCLAGCLTRWKNVECCHVRSRGAGGNDIDNCVPMCRGHHNFQHDEGIKTFQILMHVDLAKKALEYGRRWREQQGEPAA